MTHPPSRGTARALSSAEARDFLGRRHVGRIAYCFHDRVDIEPINYALENDWIYARTSLGSKLVSLAHHHWCAFEVDDVRDWFDWTSVVVHGTFYLLDPEIGAPDAHERALALLRELVPETLTADDPAPERSVLFRIHVDELTGREMRRVADAGRPPAMRERR